MNIVSGLGGHLEHAVDTERVLDQVDGHSVGLLLREEGVLPRVVVDALCDVVLVVEQHEGHGAAVRQHCFRVNRLLPLLDPLYVLYIGVVFHEDGTNAALQILIEHGLALDGA